MVWNGFCAMKEHPKVIFCWLQFFSPTQYGGRNREKFQIFEKKISKDFWSPKMVWNSFCAIKEHSKVIFVDFILFNQVVPNISVSEIVWNKSKSSQKQFLLTILLQMCSMIWKACLYFLNKCVTMCVAIRKQVGIFACMRSKLYFLYMNEQLKEKKDWKFFV